jgi:hypothetical protein
VAIGEGRNGASALITASHYHALKRVKAIVARVGIIEFYQLLNEV